MCPLQSFLIPTALYSHHACLCPLSSLSVLLNPIPGIVLPSSCFSTYVHTCPPAFYWQFCCIMIYNTEHRKLVWQSKQCSLALLRAEGQCITTELQLSSHLSCTLQHETMTVQLGCLPDEQRCCQCSGMLTSMCYFSPALKKLCRSAYPFEFQCS